MEYNFREIEARWHKRWEEENAYKVSNDTSKPKYYVLDMFPYPSGAGLHVGHPLGYIASDIYSRFKRLNGFNVLHPMGYDSFGLPTEQYAIQTGQHPAITTEKNIARYREQLDKIGLSYDWSRQVKTSDPSYYKWTQWIFLQLFKSWYNTATNKAEPIDGLIASFEKNGFAGNEEVKAFTKEQWKGFSEQEKSDVLMQFRLAYLDEAWVNWCPKLGTVLANDEVKDGVSERGGYPVERKLMPQWSMRMTAYAGRLLNDLNTLDWPESIKEAQRNWIGRSEGSSLQFTMDNGEWTITVFTTRPDTIFGATFVTLAPEHPLVKKITTPDRKAAIEAYANAAKNKSERERQAEVKKITGEFTGAYAIHPFTGKKIPVWIGEYVLLGYGTGAVMAVPAHDSRDYAFAKHFGIEIKQVIEAPAGWDFDKESYDGKEGKCINSDFLNGLEVKDAVKHIIAEIEKRGLGKGKVNFRLRDAAFGRQRYWGEPIPIYYKTVVSGQSSVVSEIPTPLDESELPLVLPEVDKFQPTETGEPPLARAHNWKYQGKYNYEHTTMPGWAGSSWYYLRYMDPNNEKEFASPDAIKYWQNIDLYMGGAEHATGHLLYFRFWTKFLYDYGYLPFNEPAKKLVNQGMIQGVSAFSILVNPETFIWNPLSPKGAIQHSEKIPFIYVSKGMADEICNNEKTQNELINFFDDSFKHQNPQFKNIIKGIDYTIELSKNTDSWFTYRRLPIEEVSSNNEIDKRELRKSSLLTTNEDAIIEFFPNDTSPYIVHREVEKMSKSKWNVINPDDMITQYGADTFRMYEMFLGPIELSKPWSTQGISGVHGFLKKLWRIFFNEKGFALSDEKATPQELKILHRTIKKVKEDIERLSFNTSISAFMICLNELNELKCNKREIMEPLLIVLSPFAPHITEELWKILGHKDSILNATFPAYNEEYLKENTFSYPVSFNGKTRFMLELPLSLTKEQIEKEVLASSDAKKWIQDNPIKKIIVVPNKIVNVVI
ncbi:MAG: leucine--tRNA ligase [Bacteroidia bacterium]